ncbi:hypothetical protein NERG_01975 [Nematocida ausubeli]|uniref:Nucleolar protein 56 n=1 Tax=Nematocida ausubeli (strain ATCC PRA-371 / ERTm2) TaxID=1913371 RepID=H8ZEF4_NEMA1|nr:hypothetical protein NERG_01975 [Nematocida ausubeli]
MAHVLVEHSVGYLLVQENGLDSVTLKEILKNAKTLGDFKKAFRLCGTLVYSDPQDALEQLEASSEGRVTPKLKEFLQINDVKVLAADKVYAQAMKDIGIKLLDEESSTELIRALRKNADSLFSVEFSKVQRSQVSLAHANSRKKIQYDTAREDHAVMQCISMLDDMTVATNDYFMRIKEMYSWHFPELITICKEQMQYLEAVNVVGNRNTANREEVLKLENGPAIVEAMDSTIGGDLIEEDFTMIMELSGVVMEKIELYTHAMQHLEKRLSTVAPNLTALVGKMVAARLILKAGGLSKLALCPSSTIQVLGAEKALFRAMKSKSKTPKYGLIFNSSFVNSTAPRMRGRVSRYLSSKCAIASRIDCYSDRVTDAYGVAMKTMVEERTKGRSTHHMPTDTVLQKVSEALGKEEASN